MGGPWRTEDCLKGGEQFEKWSPAKWVEANMAACHAAIRVIEFIRGLKWPDTLIHGITTTVDLAFLPGLLGLSQDPWNPGIPTVVLYVHNDAYDTLKQALEKRTFADGVQVVVQATANREPTIDLARDLAADLPMVLGTWDPKT